MALTLPDLMSAAYVRGCEASIVEIAAALSLPLSEHPFELSLQVERRLEEFGLVLVPPLPKGSLESMRLICSPARAVAFEDVLSEIQRGEGAAMEFKSTFMYDVARARAGTYATVSDLRSEEVMHSSLKTIAALMNTTGGVLLIGVEDSGNICGIDQDYDLLAPDKRSLDGWELELRQQVQARFYDGVVANNFVRVGFVEANGQTVARIQVTSRQRCSFLRAKKGTSYEAYVRQGNRTVSLTLPEFEEYVRTRL